MHKEVLSAPLLPSLDFLGDSSLESAWDHRFPPLGRAWECPSNQWRDSGLPSVPALSQTACCCRSCNLAITERTFLIVVSRMPGRCRTVPAPSSGTASPANIRVEMCRNMVKVNLDNNQSFISELLRTCRIS